MICKQPKTELNSIFRPVLSLKGNMGPGSHGAIHLLLLISGGGTSQGLGGFTSVQLETRQEEAAGKL